eukprot:scaffold49022_cov59-Phaeocystis_antarctica.AAC.2
MNSNPVAAQPLGAFDCWQTRQAAHSGLATSAGLSDTPAMHSAAQGIPLIGIDPNAAASRRCKESRVRRTLLYTMTSLFVAVAHRGCSLSGPNGVRAEGCKLRNRRREGASR